MTLVLLADDHGIVRQGVASLLSAQPSIEVAAQLSSGFEVMRWFDSADVDVAVVDVTMPGPEPADLLKACRERGSDARFVALTMHSEATIAQRVLNAGYIGYVHKDDAFRDLIVAIRNAADSKQFVSKSVADKLSEIPPQVEISEREHHVLRCIADGMTNKRTAVELNVSVKTVETYRSRLMKKLDVHSAAELIRVAIRRGWL